MRWAVSPSGRKWRLWKPTGNVGFSGIVQIAPRRQLPEFRNREPRLRESLWDDANPLALSPLREFQTSLLRPFLPTKRLR